MAIDSQNLSVDGVKEILDKGKKSYVDLTGDDSKADILKQALIRIDLLISTLLSEQERMFDKLGVSDIKDFKNKFNQAVNDLNLNKITGPELKRIFLNSFREAAGKYDAETKQLEPLAQQILNELMRTEKWEGFNIEQLTNLFHKTILEVIVADTGETKVDHRKLTKAAIVMEGDEGKKIAIDAMTPTIKKRLKTILKLVNSGKIKEINKDNYSVLPEIDMTNFKTDSDLIQIDIKSEWLTLTQAMSSNQLEEYLREMPAKERTTFLNEVNDNMKNYICRELGLSGNNEVRKAIDNMLKTKLTGTNDSDKIVKNMKNMFFVGTSDNEVIGLLGEIAAYAALKKAFGDKVKLKWAAQALEGGKQLSIDIVLEKMYGIQVKNTADDLKEADYEAGITLGHGISFVDKSAYDVINQLTDSEALAKVYESSYFNISYIIDHKDRPHVIPGSSDFDGIANELVSLRDSIQLFLYRFSPELVYMANDGDEIHQLATLEESLKELKGNLVYIVGNQPIFASEMLIRIRNQNILDKVNGKHIESPEKALRISGSKSITIVKYLNGLADNHQTIGLDKNGAVVGLGTVKFTSAYNF